MTGTTAHPGYVPADAIARADQPFALVQDPFPFAAAARRATAVFHSDEIDHWDPEAFRIDRANAKQHLAFGHGIHHCIGAALARLEARVVIERLTQRLPRLALAESQRLTVLPNTTFRGPRALQVSWERG